LIALFLLTFARRKRRATEQIEAILFVSLALVAGFFFFGDTFAGRIAAEGFTDVSRMAVYTITLQSILSSPILGFGYGTFVDVFPLYRDRSVSVDGVWDHAHNSYLEVWQGLGLLFGTMLIVAIGWLLYLCLKGALNRRQNAMPAIVASSACLLVAAHAIVDFSLEIEAVALTFMALLGAGVAQSMSSNRVVSD
jgi:O-antigen ligase